MNKSNSNVKPVQFVETGQVAFVAVQLINGNQSVKTYAYLDNGSCQSLLLKSTALHRPEKLLSENDKRAIEILESTTKIVDGHYQIGLLWKQGAFLPNNKWLALKQLDQLDQ